MKKKFLKVFSIFLVLISLFSILLIEAKEKTIKFKEIHGRLGGKKYCICLKFDNKEKEIKINQLPKRYKCFFDENFRRKYEKNFKESTKADPFEIHMEIEEELENKLKKNSSISFKKLGKILEKVEKEYFFNRTKRARIRQQERMIEGRNCKCLSQKLTVLVPKIAKLLTPFGEAEMEFRHGSEEYYDVFIKDTSLPSEKYVYLCNVIDAFVKNKKDFAQIIQDYLALAYNSKYDDKNLFNILDQMREDNKLKEIQKKANEFFENENNFFKTDNIIEKLKKFKNNLEEKRKKKKQEESKKRKGKLTQEETIENLINIFEECKKAKEEKQKEYAKAIEQSKKSSQKQIANLLEINNCIEQYNRTINTANQKLKEELKKVSNVLSAILLISEPGPNRACDGGKSARASLRYITDDKYKKENYSFCNVFVGDNENGPLYPVAAKNGTELARKRSQGHGRSKKQNSSFYDHEKMYSDDSDDDIDEKAQALKGKRREVKKQFNEWIQTAKPDQIENFEKKFKEFLKK